jgi:hypothetical protein
MLGETLPPILLQLKDKNKVPLAFPDAVRAASSRAQQGTH